MASKTPNQLYTCQIKPTAKPQRLSRPAFSTASVKFSRLRPDLEDVPPRRVTLRFLTLPPRQRGWARRLFNSLQVLRHRAPRAPAHHRPLAKHRSSVHTPGNIWAKLTSVAREKPSSSFNVKTPSSRVFWALFFKSLLIAMAHLCGLCCSRRWLLHASARLYMRVSHSASLTRSLRVGLRLADLSTSKVT
jgi:hypothetical protein